jgi:hypothetical protein
MSILARKLLNGHKYSVMPIIIIRKLSLVFERKLLCDIGLQALSYSTERDLNRHLVLPP